MNFSIWPIDEQNRLLQNSVYFANELHSDIESSLRHDATELGDISMKSILNWIAPGFEHTLKSSGRLSSSDLGPSRSGLWSSCWYEGGAWA